MMMLGVLYSAIVVPFGLAWETTMTVGTITVAATVDIAIEIMFLVDIAIHFSLPYLDSLTREPVESKDKIRRKYLHGWFCVDVVSALPIELTQFAWVAVGGAGETSSGGAMSVLSATRMLKLLRMAKLVRLRAIEALSQEDPTQVRPALASHHSCISQAIATNTHSLVLWRSPHPILQARMAQIMFSFFFVIHIMACGYWAMARGVCPAAISGAYVPGAAADSVHDPFCPNMDVPRLRLDWTYQYSAAFYWAVWVMLGNSSAEQIGTRTYRITAGMLVVGMICFSTILGSASAFLAQLDSEKLKRKEEIVFVRRYMQTRKISPTLQKQIGEYYDYIWDTGNTPYHKQLFDQLPQQLRALTQLQIRTTLLTKVPMFAQLAKRCVVSMLESMTARQSVQGETVCCMGGAADCIYFVEHGRLACTIRAGSAWIHVATIRSGQFFGEMGLFGQHIRAATVRAMSYSELQILAYAEFFF
jgi:hypothetical protein